MQLENVHALKSVADTIMSTPGNTRGNSLKTDMRFVIEREGKEGLKRLEDALVILGYPLSYGTVRGFDWYPEGQAVLGIHLSRHLFEWSGRDVFEMGYAAPAVSFLVRTFARFSSVETTFFQGPVLWRKHYDFGALTPETFDGENKKLSFTVSGYGFFDYMEEYFDGFFNRLTQLVGITTLKTLESTWCSESDHTCRRYHVTWT